jgi:hypothetical protein
MDKMRKISLILLLVIINGMIGCASLKEWSRRERGKVDLLDPDELRSGIQRLSSPYEFYVEKAYYHEDWPGGALTVIASNSSLRSLSEEVLKVIIRRCFQWLIDERPISRITVYIYDDFFNDLRVVGVKEGDFESIEFMH